MSLIDIDSQGYPVLLSAAPAPVPDAVQQPPQEPVTTARPDLRRRRDAVVDAARTLTALTPKEIEEHIRRRWRGDRELTKSDVAAVMTEAHRQRAEDVTDALDHIVRQGALGKREASKVIRTTFPRGALRQYMRELTDEQATSLLRRLRHRGWSSDQVRRHVVRPFKLRSGLLTDAEDEGPIGLTWDAPPTMAVDDEKVMEFELERNDAGLVTKIRRHVVEEV